MKVSYSMLSSYLACPRQCYFDYIMPSEASPKDLVPIWVGKFFGAVIHGMIGHIMKPKGKGSSPLYYKTPETLNSAWYGLWKKALEGDPVTFKRLCDQPHGVWCDDPDFGLEQYGDWGASILRKYYADNQELGPGILRELSLSMKLDAANTLVGRMDQLRPVGDTHQIIENFEKS